MSHLCKRFPFKSRISLSHHRYQTNYNFLLLLTQGKLFLFCSSAYTNGRECKNVFDCVYGCRVFSVCLFDEPHAASSKQRPLCDKGLHVYSSGIDCSLPLLISYSCTLIQRKCVFVLPFVCFLEAVLVSRLEILQSQKPFMATHCGIDNPFAVNKSSSSVNTNIRQIQNHISVRQTLIQVDNFSIQKMSR